MNERLLSIQDENCADQIKVWTEKFENIMEIVMCILLKTDSVHHLL